MLLALGNRAGLQILMQRATDPYAKGYSREPDAAGRDPRGCSLAAFVFLRLTSGDLVVFLCPGRIRSAAELFWLNIQNLGVSSAREQGC